MRALVPVVLLALSLVACGGDDAEREPAASPAGTAGSEAPTVYEVLQRDERFSTFFRLVEKHGPRLSSVMRVNTWDHTLLVPVNEAFDALPEGALDPHTANEEAFERFFGAHLIGGVVPSSEFGNVGVLAQREVTIDGDTITYGDATIIDTDIEARNGMVHAVDAVLLPEDPRR